MPATLPASLGFEPCVAYACAPALERRAVRRLGVMRVHLADERLAHWGGEEVRHDEHVRLLVHELHAREVSGDPCPRRGAHVWVAGLPGTLPARLGFEACVAHGGRGAASSSRRAGGWAARPRAKAGRQAALRLRLRLRLQLLRLHLRLRLRLRQSTA